MIEKMRKIIFIGPNTHKNELLSALQKAGVVEIEQIKTDGPQEEVSKNEANELLDLYNFIRTHTTPDVKQKNDNRENVQKIIEELRELKKEIFHLRVVEEHILENIERAKPFGRFDLELLKELEQYKCKVQFWEGPTDSPPEMPEDTHWIEVSDYGQRKYYATFSSGIDLEHHEEVVFNEDLSKIEKELEENRQKQKSLNNKLVLFFPYMNAIYTEYLRELDRTTFNEAKNSVQNTLDGHLYCLQGWCPDSDMANLKKVLDPLLVDTLEVEPLPNEKPPTHMVNDKIGEMGTDLVNVYDTPSHLDWDPSSWVFFSFAIFFAMIMADGGYGLVLLGLMLYFKLKYKNLKAGVNRFINLSIILSGGTFLYGLLSGGFFGLSESNPIFGWLVGMKLFDSTDVSSMMNAAILIGMIHVTIALVLKSKRLVKVFDQRIIPIANYAWVGIIWVFYFYYGYAKTEGDPLHGAKGFFEFLLIVGFITVFLTSAGSFKSPGKVIAEGLMGVYNSVQFFSDILSYLRLFALGMAGTLLAQTFNGLAMDVWQTGTFGMVFGVVIFILGHIVNLVLCIMSGVIHGLRLNFLEWYRWYFDGDGRAFKPFKSLLMNEK